MEAACCIVGNRDLSSGHITAPVALRDKCSLSSLLVRLASLQIPAGNPQISQAPAHPDKLAGGGKPPPPHTAIASVFPGQCVYML